VTTRYLWVIALTWVVTGLVVAFFMRRRGFDFYPWLALGTMLGPLVVPLAVERVRFHGVTEREAKSTPTPPRRGLDILVGLDGSGESAAALVSAVELFGPLMTSLTIATVLDYDSESFGGLESRQAAQTMLEEAASRIDLEVVETRILFGRADRALAEYARANGVEMIVVGARGRGATEALFGSITSRLVGGCKLPVLVGPRSAGTEHQRHAASTQTALAE